MNKLGYFGLHQNKVNIYVEGYTMGMIVKIPILFRFGQT